MISCLLVYDCEFIYFNGTGVFVKKFIGKKNRKKEKKTLEDTANQGRCFSFVFSHRFRDTLVFKLIYLQNCVIRL